MKEVGQRLAFSMDFGYRRHDMKIYQLTESEMTAIFLGLIPFACSHVNDIAFISVKSANECLVGRV